MYLSIQDLPEESVWLGIYACPGKQQKKPALERAWVGADTLFFESNAGKSLDLGAEGGSRSHDQGLMSPLLYH
jgi:hypothetical protein